MMLEDAVINNLRCPKTHEPLIFDDGFLCSTSNKEVIKYPVIDNIPILINENKSFFNIDQYKSKVNTTINSEKIISDSNSKFRKFLLSLIPSLTVDLNSSINFDILQKKIFELSHSPKILIIGGATLGSGMANFMNSDNATIVESDVAFGTNTNIIFDAHDIPFVDGYFDAVIIQAVLEHVVDPKRCVDEIYRVLNKDGLVYSDIPFIQQVHMGRYDFSRFTFLGQLILFKDFDEIKSGMSSGPGSALAWSIYYFLISFTNKKAIRRVLYFLVAVLTLPIKFFDYFLKDKKPAFDAAGGFYFLGRKSHNKKPLDANLLNRFKGCEVR
jgi:SAM-dependent methyltransferase